MLASPASLSVLSLRDVTKARVPRSGLSGRGVLVWALAGAAVSGFALTVACNSVEGADCGGLLPAVFVSWGLVGGLGAGIAGSGTRPIRLDATTLAPYARFPQGLPDGFAPRP